MHTIHCHYHSCTSCQPLSLFNHYHCYCNQLWRDARSQSAKRYTAKGALFWPDFCNMISMREETYGVFGLSAPSDYVQPRPNKTTIWQHTCAKGIATELETGQVSGVLFPVFHRQWCSIAVF